MRDTIGKTRSARTPPLAALGPGTNERNPMAKSQDSKKQTKKVALKTPQQKRDAKREKRLRRGT